MLTVRKSKDCGVSDYGWFKSTHSFSFGEYHDPSHMGWGNLRVINDDYLAPSKAGGPHPHHDMEIISYVLTGALAHRDSIGNGTTIPAGDVQHMSAGTGVMHAESSATSTETTHFLQIWIEPSKQGLKPSYSQITVPPERKRGLLCLIAASGASANVINIHADARLYAGLFDGTEYAELKTDPARKYYVHVVTGEIKVNDVVLKIGDAALLNNEFCVKITDGHDAEILVFDLKS